MTMGKAHTEQALAGRKPPGQWLMPAILQLTFLLAGLAMTAMAFIFLNVFIKNMIKDEYTRATQNTVKSLVSGLSELEVSVESASHILSLSKDVERAKLANKVREAVASVANFDQILWVYKGEDGQWQSVTVYAGGAEAAAAGRYTLVPDAAFLAYIDNHKLFGDPAIRVVADLNFTAVEQPRPSTGVMIKPFALVKPVEVQNPGAGLVIGVTTAAAVLNDDWLWHADFISRISIREVASGLEIYNLQRKSQPGDELSELNQVFDFTFGNRPWEIRAEFLKEPKIYFLESMPLFLIIFGVITTALGTLYIRNTHTQAVEVRRMYEALQQKNTELESQIAEGQRLHNTLEKSEKENRSIIDAVSDIIFETDTDGRILFLSASWRKVTGFDPEQSKGLELFKMLHAQDQEQQRRDFTLMVRGQKPAYRAFTRLRTSDGTFRAVEIAISMIRQDENRNLRVVGTFTDVEERRRAERALGEAEKKYRTIVENAAGGIYQLTPEGLYLSANPAMARILRYDGPDEILRTVKNANETIYVSPRDRQNFLRDLEIRGMVNNYECEIYTRDGQKVWVNENVRVVRDEAGNTLYYEGSMEDISRRKQTDISLREAKINSDLANRAKSEFLANMSHELRTPLNSIIGFSEIIKDEVFGPVEPHAYWDYAKHIHESGRKLLTVINEILDISKIEAGDRQLNESVVDLNKLVAGCLSLLSNKVEANHMTVTNTLQDVPPIIAEELAIKQVVMNLLSNAVKFTPSGGRVTISSDTDKDGNLRLSVTDTGIGLDEAEIRKALSPFGQVDNELSRSNSGTGLGLTLVDALVKLHGGTLELFSQKGIGTTVTVMFPAERVTAPKKETVKPTQDA